MGVVQYAIGGHVDSPVGTLNPGFNVPHVDMRSHVDQFSPLHVVDCAFLVDVSGESKYNEGDSVATPEDFGPSRYSLTQSTSSKQMAYKRKIFGNLPAIFGDGIDDHYAFPAGALGLFQNADGGSLIAVVKVTLTTAADRDPLVFQNGTGASRLRIANPANTGTTGATARRLDADATILALPLTVDLLPHSIIAVADWASGVLKVFIDKEKKPQFATTAFTASGKTSNTASAAAVIGAFDTAGTDEFNGYIGIACGYSRAITRSEVKYLKNGLAKIWGCPLG